ncbi:MAG: hypothetical protein DRP59_11055 [Spirochaetes bacterium]|nr:MAG: hypothetical protein DRP59_11055 [Spirochaetota bacterium]
MKQIILMRHCHAASRQTGESDESRGLDGKGIRQAAVIGSKMVSNRMYPDLIIHSSAVRALETASIIKDALESDCVMQPEPLLYSASLRIYEEIICSVPDIHTTVMLIAHNPVLEEVVSNLLAKHTGMGTAHLLFADIKIDFWRDFKLSGNTFIKTQFLSPESSE